MTKTAQLVRSFARRHDELPAFHAGYIVLTFLVAALFNLGVFALLIVVHMVLDLVKYREMHGKPLGTSASFAFRESLGDVALFMTGMSFAVYFHHSFAIIAGVSGVVRSVFSVVGALGTVWPKYAILQKTLSVFGDLNAHFRNATFSRETPWTATERFSGFVIGCNVVFILAASTLLHRTAQDVIDVIAKQLFTLY